MADLEKLMGALMIFALQKHCVNKCILRPRDELTHGEKECLAGCEDKFLEAYQIGFQVAATSFEQTNSKMSRE